MTGPTTSRQQWLALGVLCLPVLVTSMDVSVLFFAVPYIAGDLAPSATEQLWIFDIYGFVLAGLLLPMGAVGDRIGRRRLLLIGLVLFGVASVAAAYAASATWLIAARAALGLGGATLMPSTLGLIRAVFDDESSRSRAVAIWSSVMAAGVGVGPVLSGLLLEHYWWGSVFLVNVPVIALAVLLAPRLLPEARAGRSVPVDPVSVSLSLVAVLTVVWAAKQLATQGWSPAIGVAALLGAGAGALFVRRQERVPEPLVELDLLRRRAFAGSLAVNALAMAGVTGNAVLLTAYLQSVLGYSPLAGALWSLAPSLLVGAAVPAAAAVGQRIGRPAVMTVGFVVAAIGFVGMLSLQTDSPVWAVLWPACCVATGLVAVATLVTDYVVGVVPAQRAGRVAGLVETTSELGAALGIAGLGSILTAAYRAATDALPAGLPPAVRAAARETLAGAEAVAAGLPAELGDAVRAQARAAYTSAMHRTDLAAAALMLVGAFVAYAALARSAGREGADHPRGGGATEDAGQPSAGLDEGRQVDPGLHAGPVQSPDEILGGQVAGGTLGVGTTAEPTG